MAVQVAQVVLWGRLVGAVSWDLARGLADGITLAPVTAYIAQKQTGFQERGRPRRFVVSKQSKANVIRLKGLKIVASNAGLMFRKSRLKRTALPRYRGPNSVVAASLHGRSSQ